MSHKWTEHEIIYRALTDWEAECRSGINNADAVGTSHNQGDHLDLAYIRGYRDGLSKDWPEHLQAKFDAAKTALDNEADPDWREYQRLRLKFGRK
jgi:hypothetical protein